MIAILAIFGLAVWLVSDFFTVSNHGLLYHGYKVNYLPHEGLFMKTTDIKITGKLFLMLIT
jgi:hypothetical protein